MRYLVPIAAPEDLFPRKDFHFPKPQIEIDGRPMIARVIENLSRNDPAARFIFVVRAQDCRQFSLDDTLIRLFPSQFWIDAGIGIGALVLLASIVTLVLMWPTRRRRGVAPQEKRVDGEQEKVDQP